MYLDISVLAIDDDEDILFALKMFLSGQVKKITTETNPENIIKLLTNNEYDLVLLDMNFTKDTISGSEGFTYLSRIKTNFPDIVVIFLTAYGDVEKAVKALKEGASDFVLKPWQNEKLLATMNSATEFLKSKKENKLLKNKQQSILESTNKSYQQIIGTSKKMKEIFSIIECVAPTDANILITGENGTGKELVAKAIHNKSKYYNDLFLAVDLGSIPESLFESELFGHTKGAFTDAKVNRIGKFEAAKDGTLFLDEIGNLSLSQQSKLLTAIEKRYITPIGSNKKTPINVRLICATNNNLNELIINNMFRQDLLYRINTVEIHLPPLRERTEDIPLIAEHYLKIFKKKYKKENLSLSTDAITFLQKYKWFGNVRELRHALERAVILTKNQNLSISDFTFLTNDSFHQNKIDKLNTNIEIKDINSLESIEKDLIINTLKKFNGNISNTAKELGLTRPALYRRIKKYDI
ncbi:MAG: sigma-54 dependent transcriptional regulator [Candidatus Cloacimonetes bacterium]|nr:sigma-54 dependent transcriptional regulator [Candidatus Cloacimonadota bacterium]MDD4156884.1 sigma-54 dependent transcriptional regulator [Candidatus Cloacimonadota bacterium]